MLKTGLKNFFKNLLYVFVPMGILYLFLIVAVFGFVRFAASQLGVMVSDVFALISKSVGSAGTDIQSFLEFAMGQIDWNAGFFQALRQVFKTNWLQNTVTGFFQTLNVSVEGFSAEFQSIFNTFLKSIVSAFAVAVVFLFLGLYLADFATGYLLRRKIAKRTWKQTVLNWLIKPTFTSLLTLALLWVATLLKGYTLLLVVVGVLVYETLSFAFSWLLYRDKTVKFKEVVNLKNIALNFLTAIIILALDIAVFFLIKLLSTLIAILILIPLLIYSLKILDFNADSYIRSLTQEKTE